MANETNVPHAKPTTLEGWVKLLDGVRLPVPQEAHDKVCRAIRDNRSSLRDIAGICNKERNVLGMMPHPERATDPLMGSTDGLTVFRSMVSAFAAK